MASCNPSLRNNHTIENNYRATKNIDYALDKAWEAKPNKSDVYAGAITQLVGSVLNVLALCKSIDGNEQASVLWHGLPLLAMAGGSLHGVIDAYVNPGEGETVY